MLMINCMWFRNGAYFHCTYFFLMKNRPFGRFYVIRSTGIFWHDVFYRLAAMKRASQANHAEKVPAAPQFTFTFSDFHIWVSHQPTAEKWLQLHLWECGWHLKCQTIHNSMKKEYLLQFSHKQKKGLGYLWEDLPQEWSVIFLFPTHSFWEWQTWHK